jgi:preprotein translocase subunit YajC
VLIAQVEGGGNAPSVSDPASALMMGAAPQAATPGAPGTVAAPAGTAPPAQQSFPTILILVGALMVFMMVQAVLTSRRERKSRAAMMSSLRKHDKVVTVGGVMGTVVEVGDNDVVLKVDENANTRIRFTKASIQQVLTAAGDKAAAALPEPDPKIEVKTKGQKATV